MRQAVTVHRIQTRVGTTRQDTCGWPASRTRHGRVRHRRRTRVRRATPPRVLSPATESDRACPHDTRRVWPQTIQSP